MEKNSGRRGSGTALLLIVCGCVLLALCLHLHRMIQTRADQPEETAAPTEPAALPSPEPTPASTPAPEVTPPPGPLVVIDPGHQLHGDFGQEPIGPGALETKARVTDGTQGVVTGIYEYELNLAVSLLLRDELEARGYRVVLTREENDVSLSNAERAAIANDLQADAFVRIHANGVDDSSVRGIMTICMSAQNPYNAALYSSSRSLADALLRSLGEALACDENHRSLWETDSMSGINYSLVPVCIVEMGYMSNPEEDRLLADGDYRQTIARGLADGLDAWFAAGRESGETER